MSRHHGQYRESRGYCEETCPDVDRAFDALIEEIERVTGESNDAVHSAVWACCNAVKDKGTLLLRAALVSACEDKAKAEEECADAQREAESLRGEIADLKSEIRSLERELAEAVA